MGPAEFLRWCVSNYVTHDCHNDPECEAFLCAERNRSEALRAVDALEHRATCHPTTPPKTPTESTGGR